MSKRWLPQSSFIAAFTVMLLSAGLTTVAIAQCVPEPTTTLEMRQCASEELKTTEQQLENTYQALLSAQAPTAQQKLKEAQQAWISYQESHCEFEASQFEGGSISPLVHLNCLVQQTKERTQLLNRLQESL